MNNIIVFCETDNGKLCDVSLELLTKARSLAQTLNCDLEALLIGYNVENLKDELYLYGVKTVHLADDKQLEFFRTLPYASIAISYQCGVDNEDRYKEAVKWCDYLYSDEGTVLKCFGVEGETFTIEKGEDGEDHYVYTEKITDHESIGAHSVEAALWHFFRPANSPGLNQHPDYLNGYYPYEQQKEAIVVWNTYIEEAKKYKLQGLSYTGHEATDKANIEAKGRDNLDAAISNIILGKASIDTYDAIIEQAKKDGYDDLLKIQQAAYDRYIKVINESK